MHLSFMNLLPNIAIIRPLVLQQPPHNLFALESVCPLMKTFLFGKNPPIF